MANGREVLRDGGLPAEEFRLVGKDFMIKTPVDERGLVDVAEHIRLVKLTLSPNIVWDGTKPNIHHFYWPAKYYYQNDEDSNQTPMMDFRNLPIHKGLLPVKFHNWMHRITEPPKVPEREIIDHRIESWLVAEKLFHAVRYYKRHDRMLQKRLLKLSEDPEMENMSNLEKEAISDLYYKFFKKYPKLLDQLFQIPEEYRLVDPEKPFDQLNKDLGKIAGRNSLILTRMATI